ncbi:hypothetical protein BGZ49_009915 [Haplosporangium sp. Z 27]|nr:hypothetical protein BGZ49_009915 [Haplosporangium sp. Z 27]
MVHETTSTPWPHILNISYKLRVLIRFDQALSKERQLQLSFPISIHPTLSANGSPVHPQPFYLNSDSTNRRMMRRALYGVGSRSDQNDDDEYIDEEDYPLPIYGNREDSLLLMVEQDIQEAGLQVDALGASMGINILDQGMLRSPSESSAYFSSSAPNTPESINSSSINSPSFPFVNGSVSEGLQQQQDQHPLGRSVSLTPVSPMNPFNLHIEPRRHSTIEQINSFLYPPPYIMPILTEDRSDEAVVTSTSGRLNDGFMPEDISSTEQEIHDHEHSVEPEGESGTEEIMRVVSTETVRTSVHFSLPTPPYEA